MVDRVAPTDRDQEIRQLRTKIAQLDKEIEDAKFWHDHHPEKYGPLRVSLSRQRMALAAKVLELDQSRPLNESRGWSPGSSSVFFGSNH